MRTNIMLDDKLVEKGMKYTGIKTKKALRELVQRKKRKGSAPVSKVSGEGNQ